MTVSTYGVTQAMIEAELRGSDLTTISADITRWVAQYASIADTIIRQNGYDPVAIDALGATNSLYNMCQLYVTKGVAADVARSGALQDVSLGEILDARRVQIEQRIQAMPLAVSETSDRLENRGGALTNLDNSSLPIRRQQGFWRPGMKF